jgi:hypothetical protein
LYEIGPAAAGAFVKSHLLKCLPVNPHEA